MTGRPLDDRCPEILRRASPLDVLARHGHEPARQSGGTMYYHCPLPSHEDRSPSFTVTGEIWRCWSQCDLGGDVIDLVVQLDACSKQEAIERLADLAGLDRRERAQVSALSPEHAAKLLRRFLDDRGWDRDTAREVGLHVVLDGGGRPRVRFPYAYGTEVVWHQDRAIGTAAPKWLSPKGQRPAIYNANALRIAHDCGEVLVTEGPADVMAVVSTYENPAAVGIPGSGSFSRDWVPAFAGLKRVYVVGDNDAAGGKFRQRCRTMLSPVVRSVLDVHVPAPYGDLDDWRRGCGTDEPEQFGEPFLQALEQAESVEAAA